MPVAWSLWSTLSVGRKGRFVRDEADYASQREILVPIRIDEVRPPIGFGEVEFVDLLGCDGDASDERVVAIVEDVCKKLDLPQSPAPPPTNAWARRLRRYRTPLAAGFAAVAIIATVVAYTNNGVPETDSSTVLPTPDPVAGPKTTEVTRLTAKLQNNAPFSMTERALAIDSLRTRKAGDAAELAAVHGGGDDKAPAESRPR